MRERQMTQPLKFFRISKSNSRKLLRRLHSDISVSKLSSHLLIHLVHIGRYLAEPFQHLSNTTEPLLRFESDRLVTSSDGEKTLDIHISELRVRSECDVESERGWVVVANGTVDKAFSVDFDSLEETRSSGCGLGTFYDGWT